MKENPPRTVHGKVLVVDDEPDIVQAIKATLEAFLDECAVVTAESGPAALDVLQKERVDLILTDFRMPDMDGLQFLAQADKLAPHTPRIMLTAYPDLDLAMRALNETHILNFLTKPIQSESLLKAVREALATRQDRARQAQAVAAAMERIRRAKKAGPPPGAPDPVDGQD